MAEKLSTFQIRCLNVVRELLKRNKWQLISEAEFHAALLNNADPLMSESQLFRLAKNTYSITHYNACQQTWDLTRREQAYTELYDYFIRVGYKRWPDLYETLAQNALALVFEKIDTCENPDRFHVFAFYKLLQAFEERLRKNPEGVPLDKETISTFDEAGQSTVELEETRQILLKALANLPRNQRLAIALKYLAGWSDKEISEELAVSLGNVRVLRSRGIAVLRRDEELSQYFDEFE